MSDVKHEPLKDVIALADPNAVIVLMGLIGVSWGFFLLLPQFDVFDLSVTFTLMDLVLPEWLWGLAFMTVAGSKLVVWYRNYGRTTVTKTQVLLNAATTVLWLIVTLSFILSRAQSTAVITYGWFFIASLWATSRRWSAWRRLTWT